MIDIHHHLIYGVDDGAKDLEMSIGMAEVAIAEGVTHIACTPHSVDSYVYQLETNLERMAEIQAAVAGRLELILACDFHLNADNIQDAIQNPLKYSIGGKGYLLVEFPEAAIPPQLGASLNRLKSVGYTCIITHPERNPVIVKHPQMLADWIRMGCVVQVTAGSVLGLMGEAAQKMAHTLLTNRWVHFLATDAHNLDRRSPRMSEARETIARRYGADYANLLCVTNPTAVYNGQLLPEQEEPLRLYDDDDYLGAPWWKKLFKGRG